MAETVYIHPPLPGADGSAKGTVMRKGPYLLLALSGGILLTSLMSAHALEITVRDGDVTIKTDEANPAQVSESENDVSVDEEGISIGNITSNKQESGIHRSTRLENVTIIKDGKKTTYINGGTK